MRHILGGVEPSERIARHEGIDEAGHPETLLRHRAFGKGRGDGVGPDPEVSEVVGDAFHHRLARAFRGDIGHVVVDQRLGGGGRQRDDRPAGRLLFAHDAHEGLREVMHPLELQVGDLVELFLRDLERVGEQPPAGGVDRDIDPPEGVARLVGQRVDLSMAGDVAQGIFPADFRREIGQRGLLAARDHHLRAFGGEQAGDHLPHVAGRGRPQNDGALAFELSHRVSPLSGTAPTTQPCAATLPKSVHCPGVRRAR